MPLKIDITELGLNGQGVGSDPEGNLYFVPFAIPGDKVRVREISRKGRFVDATLVEVVKPSTDRVNPPCPYFGACGGCDLQHMEYVAQVKAKERVLHHVLQRAELNAKELLPSVPSPHFYHYRNRIQLHQREGRWGFYKKNSREWVGIEQCLLAKEEINQALKELKAKESNVEISVNESGEVKVFSDEKSLSFQQVNSEQNDFLKASVSRFTNKFKSRYVLELYCGEGNLSFSVNGSLEYLLGIDSSELAIQKAMSKTDSKRHFVARSIDSELISHLPKDFVSSYDTLILDPPRTGVGKCITTFLNPSLKNIFYVSCSPVTFSHDAKKLVEKGFILNSVQMVDMFPQTHHIELIAEFSR